MPGCQQRGVAAIFLPLMADSLTSARFGLSLTDRSAGQPLRPLHVARYSFSTVFLYPEAQRREKVPIFRYSHGRHGPSASELQRIQHHEKTSSPHPLGSPFQLIAGAGLGRRARMVASDRRDGIVSKKAASDAD